MIFPPLFIKIHVFDEETSNNFNLLRWEEIMYLQFLLKVSTPISFSKPLQLLKLQKNIDGACIHVICRSSYLCFSIMDHSTYTWHLNTYMFPFSTPNKHNEVDCRKITIHAPVNLILSSLHTTLLSIEKLTLKHKVL